MLASEGELEQIADWLLEMASASSNLPIESMIDLLFGASVSQEFTSPLKEYFFSDIKLAETPDQYISHLGALSTIRASIREYKPGINLKLADFVQYVNLARRAGITLKNHHAAEQIDDAVRVMTAHKSKGLEFESIYIINASDDTWGSKSRGSSGRLSYPENIAIGQAGDNYDDKLRLFFVAMTRAKKQLHISYSDQNLAGKPALKADFLSQAGWKVKQDSGAGDTYIEAAEHTWQTQILPSHDQKLTELLAGQLRNYQLSATHLNNFIDVTSGGPRNFLLNNLLHFPQSISPSAAMGSAVHKALQKAHQHLRVTGVKRPTEDVVGDFEQYLGYARLPEIDFSHQLQKGSDGLRQYLDQRYDSFSPEQTAEFDFSRQGSSLDEARLTGIIDILQVNEKTKKIDLADYKTGKPATNWQGKTDFEKIKLHKYKQQLMFYRLLIESSRQFHGYKVTSSRLEFIEPTRTGDIVALNAQYTSEELVHFKRLIKVVWQCILDCDFADTSDYEKTYKGILGFEKDLLKR